MLPLSLVMLVFGWIFGFVSSLVGVFRMLLGSAFYILFCSKSRKVSSCHSNLGLALPLCTFFFFILILIFAELCC